MLSNRTGERSTTIASKLTGQLAALTRYRGTTVPEEYLGAIMTRLHKKFLKVPLGALLHPVSVFVQQATKTSRPQLPPCLRYDERS
ncbi:MAG: hypothetical protein P0120_07225 [Nitrospira sp.]|nr:hypothetical protein [Nitrospira sp.]